MLFRRAVAILVLAAGVSLTKAQDSDGEWSAGGSGSWANANDWDGGIIADGTDNAAYFGISLEPPIPATATFTLDGARTIGYVDLSTTNLPANWSLNTGSGGPLTLDTTFDTPAVQVDQAGLQFTINTVVAGVVGLEKLGPGVLVLTATNLYTGGTTLSAGTLLVNGMLTDTDAVTVISGTLGGTGMISGPVIVESGALFSPGGSLGTFTISNSLTLESGSKTWIDVNASTLAHDIVPGITTANYGGTLTVSNLAGTPTLGQSFQIFSAADSSGNFSSITPQLSGGLRWRFDPASGALSVVGTNLQPRFSSLALEANNLVFFVTNGVPDATNYVLMATNLALPRGNWTRLATNLFDAGGNLAFTNAISPAIPGRFYLISIP